MPDSTDTSDSQLIPAGRINGVHGVRGWVRVVSWFRPPENLLNYTNWIIDTPSGYRNMELVEGVRRSSRLIARLSTREGQIMEDRDQAVRLVGSEIMVKRTDLPDLPTGEYYWADLLDLEVVNRTGYSLGRVSKILETGANDVLVVQGDRERLIPFVRDNVVMDIDLAEGRMTVDWEADY